MSRQWVSTTQRPGKMHWTEIEIEQPAEDEWIVTITGCTSVDGEWDLIKSRPCASEAEVVAALRDKNGHLSQPAQEVLKEAGIRWTESDGTHP